MLKKFLIMVALLVSVLAAPLLSQSMEGPPSDIGDIDETAPALKNLTPTCGTPQPDRASISTIEKLLTHADRTLPKAGEIRIPVAVHLITAGREGAFSSSVLSILINNLNVAYSGTPFSFYLVKLDKTNNRRWYNGCGFQTANEKAMKKKLAYNPAQVLNIYSCKPAGPGLPAGIIGYAYFPWWLPENSYLQGAVIHPGTLPTGSGISGYDYYGLNAVHEVGHWLGLYHVFQGGCLSQDEVADTPAQADPSFTCDLHRDSCPASSGFDDVKNFMNYANDFCYEHFTVGQAERMIAVVRALRPSLH
jgi:hypothetical protein